MKFFKNIKEKFNIYIYIRKELMTAGKISLVNFWSTVKYSLSLKDVEEKKIKINDYIANINKKVNPHFYFLVTTIILLIYNLISITFLNRTFFHNSLSTTIIIQIILFVLLLTNYFSFNKNKIKLVSITLILIFYGINFLLLMINLNTNLATSNLHIRFNPIIGEIFYYKEIEDVVITQVPNLIFIPTMVLLIPAICLYIKDNKNKVEKRYYNYNKYLITLLFSLFMLVLAINYIFVLPSASENYSFYFMLPLMIILSLVLLYSVITFYRRNLFDFVGLIILMITLSTIDNLGFRLSFYSPNFPENSAKMKFLLPFFTEVNIFKNDILIDSYYVLSLFPLFSFIIFTLSLGLYIFNDIKTRKQIIE